MCMWMPTRSTAGDDEATSMARPAAPERM